MRHNLILEDNLVLNAVETELKPTEMLAVVVLVGRVAVVVNLSNKSF